jgi:hypothetical protein
LMNIYPNPAKDWITICLNPAIWAMAQHSTSPVYHLAILDITGREVRMSFLESCEHTHSLSVDSLPPGLYIVLLKEGGKVILTAKAMIE